MQDIPDGEKLWAKQHLLVEDANPSSESATQATSESEQKRWLNQDKQKQLKMLLLRHETSIPRQTHWDTAIDDLISIADYVKQHEVFQGDKAKAQIRRWIQVYKDDFDFNWSLRESEFFRCWGFAASEAKLKVWYKGDEQSMRKRRRKED